MGGPLRTHPGAFSGLPAGQGTLSPAEKRCPLHQIPKRKCVMGRPDRLVRGLPELDWGSHLMSPLISVIQGLFSSHLESYLTPSSTWDSSLCRLGSTHLRSNPAQPKDLEEEIRQRHIRLHRPGVFRANSRGRAVRTRLSHSSRCSWSLVTVLLTSRSRGIKPSLERTSCLSCQCLHAPRTLKRN